MTRFEIEQKIDRIMVSDSPYEDKKEAIEKLEVKLRKPKKEALKVISESQPDYSDIGGHDA